MKKRYIKPAFEVAGISRHSIMAASITVNGSTGSAGLNDDYAEGEAMSKRGSFNLWED